MDISTSINYAFGINKNFIYTILGIVVVCIGWYFYKKLKSND